ncbi:hypothetical protein D3C72_1690060 [compost metagenome]
MGSNSNTVAPPQHWPRLAPRLKRSRRVSWLRLCSISRASCIALYSRWPPPMVSKMRSVVTTIFEPALRGVEPRSSMMVTSTQGWPCCCSSARALIQLICSASRLAAVVPGVAGASCSVTGPESAQVWAESVGYSVRCVLSLFYTPLLQVVARMQSGGGFPRISSGLRVRPVRLLQPRFWPVAAISSSVPPPRARALGWLGRRCSAAPGNRPGWPPHP